MSYFSKYNVWRVYKIRLLSLVSKEKHAAGNRGGWESKASLLVVGLCLVLLHFKDSHPKNSLT